MIRHSSRKRRHRNLARDKREFPPPRPARLHSLHIRVVHNMHRGEAAVFLGSGAGMDSLWVGRFLNSDLRERTNIPRDGVRLVVCTICKIEAYVCRLMGTHVQCGSLHTLDNECGPRWRNRFCIEVLASCELSSGLAHFWLP